MSGDAWPFYVGGAICLINFVNKQYLSLLNNYVLVILLVILYGKCDLLNHKILK